MQKLIEHYALIELATVQTLKRVGNIEYALFNKGKQRILYIPGSNQRKDWFFNLAYFGILFHLGYVILARLLKKKIKDEKDLIIIGHSLGAGIASMLYWLMGKRIKYVILMGCPACYTWINPLVPKRMYNYRVKGDIIGASSILNPMMRSPRIAIRLPNQFNKSILNHYISGYELAFIQKIAERKVSDEDS